jgi:uncharacterized protein
MTYTDWNVLEEYDVTENARGIKATRDIPKGHVIGIYNGPIVSFDIENGRLKDKSAHRYIVQIAMTEGRLMGMVDYNATGIGYINHSCNANIVAKDRIILVADRDIEAGEALVMDYQQWDLVPEGISCWCQPSLCMI